MAAQNCDLGPIDAVPADGAPWGLATLSLEITMIRRLKLLTFALALAVPAAAIGQPGSGEARPTIVLVHGAFAESSSWDPVIERLASRGYRVIAAANALRGVKSDA